MNRRCLQTLITTSISQKATTSERPSLGAVEDSNIYRQQRVFLRCLSTMSTYALGLFLASQEDNVLASAQRKFFAHISHKLYLSDDDVLQRSKSGRTNVGCVIFSAEFVKTFCTGNVHGTFFPIFILLSYSATMPDINIDIVSVRVAGCDGLPTNFYKRLAHWLATACNSNLFLIIELTLRHLTLIAFYLKLIC